MLPSVLVLATLQAAIPAGAGTTYPGQGSPTVPLPRVEAQITVDGRLDEIAWAGAARLVEFWQYQPVDGRPAEERTEVLVWYTADAIYFGILAFDQAPDRIRATVAERDAIDGDDHVVLYLDTFGDRRRAFFFAVNPLGVQQDGVRTEGGRSPGQPFGGGTDENPDFYFESAGVLSGSGYVVEVRIPFTSLRFPPSESQQWGIQVERIVQRTGHTYTWTDARRANASFLAQAGRLSGLRNLERGIVVEAQPFVTATSTGVRNEGNGAFERHPIDAEAGVNARIGFAGLSLDATVNPDFSQVEADVGQVAINERFTLFFPEKRPFFLEGIDLFATPNQLVHTRTIANPSVGGKVTGKLGGISVAHLTAADEAEDGDALFNVTRLRRDFAESSVAGLTFTDRSLLDDDAHNRVLAADVRHVFGRMYFLEAQLGGAWTRDADGRRAAPLWSATLDRTGRHWGFNYQLNGIGEDFVSRAGYVPRSGIVDGHAFNRLSLYGSPGAALEQLTFFLGLGRLWRYADFGSDAAIEGNESLSINPQFRGGWEVRAEIRREFFALDRSDYTGYQTTVAGGRAAYQPLDEVSGVSLDISANTPAFQRFDANVSFAHGRAAIFPEGAEGTETEISSELALRPTGSLRFRVSGTYERLSRTRDGSRFAETLIPRFQTEIQPTRGLFFRVIAEYRSERQAALADARTGAPLVVDGAPVAALETDALRVDLLASFEPSPGTVAYLGYGASLAGADELGPDRLRRQTDGFFLKLAYRFRQ